MYMYRRSQEIERRLTSLVDLIRSGKYGTPALAAQLRISPPTVSRCLSALRQRGYVIRAVKEDDRWAYEITRESRSKAANERIRAA
jgi:DNA-binding MarR family transcriptional regulator